MAKNSPYVGWSRGIDDLRGTLRAIADPQRTARILEVAVKAAVVPILIAAKRFAKRSEDTGALSDSLTIKTVRYANPKPVAVALVGPDRAYRAKGRKVNALGALAAAASGTLRRPANYAHLVEFGHRIAVGGTLKDKHELKLTGTGKYNLKTGREVKRFKRGAVIQKATGRAGGEVGEKPFLRPAVITTRAAQTAAFTAALEIELGRELALLNRRAAA